MCSLQFYARPRKAQLYFKIYVKIVLNGYNILMELIKYSCTDFLSNLNKLKYCQMCYVLWKHLYGHVIVSPYHTLNWLVHLQQSTDDIIKTNVSFCLAKLCVCKSDSRLMFDNKSVTATYITSCFDSRPQSPVYTSCSELQWADTQIKHADSDVLLSYVIKKQTFK